jgi:alpha-D-xyloside xylohydrolase
MKRRHFLSLSVSTAALSRLPRSVFQSTSEAKHLHSGIWKFTLGDPEKITPVSTRRYQPAISGLDALSKVDTCPVAVAGTSSRRGYLISIPLGPNEMVYGLGLQMQSFIQRGLKKKLRVNADPKVDSGDSHAPVPFYVTTRGYGVLVDTARYATFYCGNKRRKPTAPREESSEAETGTLQGLLPAAYRRYRFGEVSEVLVEIPEADGVDVYIFGGPTKRLAVQRYNLFAGGGPLPPRWGLCVW